MQYENLIKTKNSLSEPLSEPLPDFVSPSSASMNFNTLPSFYSSRINRPNSISTNYSTRTSYYDYPFEMHPGDFDFQNNSDFSRYNNPQPSMSSKMNMENNGRFSTSSNNIYPSIPQSQPQPSSSSAYLHENDDPSSSSFHFNYNGRNGGDNNPNRTPNINSNLNPRYSNMSYNSNYNQNNRQNYQNSFYAPSNTQQQPQAQTQPNPQKGGLFNFLRKRKRSNTNLSESFYPNSYSMMPSPSSFEQNNSQITNISSYSKKANLVSSTMDVCLTKPFYYYFIPLTRRKVKVHVDPLLRTAINYAKAAGNYECLRYLCEFEKIPNKYIDLRSIEEAAAHNDLEELRLLLKHSWIYDIKRYFVLIFKLLFLAAMFILILYCFNGFNEILIALFVTYIAICIIYNWISRDQ